MRGQGIYGKFGWEDVDCIDVDLAERAGPGLGYQTSVRRGTWLARTLEECGLNFPRERLGR